MKQQIAALQESNTSLLATLAGKLNTGNVTRATDITTEGYAVDARELNPSVNGSLANTIGSLLGVEDITRKRVFGSEANSNLSKIYYAKNAKLLFGVVWFSGNAEKDGQYIDLPFSANWKGRIAIVRGDYEVYGRSIPVYIVVSENRIRTMGITESHATEVSAIFGNIMFTH